ncbi:MAG TPA: DUF2141 domain-containing protein [Chitinophagaceae bacterium]|nr:DUF2141 domain-containing protein [Chitinophagaceae bacterium]
MKKIVAVLTGFFICILIQSFSFTTQQAGLRVDVTGLHHNNGYVLVSVYKEGSGFPDNPDRAVKKVKLLIKDKKATITFTDISAGIYAVAILHDENNDQKLNTNGLGIPKEGYGFSNNVIGAFGPPSFKRASFNYTGSLKVISIRTRY